MLELLERVKNVARGAALMTETEVEIQVLSAVSNLLDNPALETAMFDAMTRLGAPEWMSRTVPSPRTSRAPSRRPTSPPPIAGSG